MFIRQHRLAIAVSLGIVTTCAVAARAQRPQALPLDPPREHGTSITPAFEGWYPNPDGTFSILVGYYNRNTKEALEIPVGPNNKVGARPSRSGATDVFRDRTPVGCLRRESPEGLPAIRP